MNGGLPRLLAALSVSQSVPVSDTAVRLSLATVAFMLLQDRANVCSISEETVVGLVGLFRPLAASQQVPTPRVPSSTIATHQQPPHRKKRRLRGTEALDNKNVNMAEASKVRDLLQRVKLDPFEAAQVTPAELALVALHHAVMRAADQSSSYRTGAGHGDGDGDGEEGSGGSGSSQLGGGMDSGRATTLVDAKSQAQSVDSTAHRISSYLRTTGGLEVLADLVAIAGGTTEDALRRRAPARWSWSLLHALELLNEASHPSCPENITMLTATVTQDGQGRSANASIVPSLITTIRLCCSGFSPADVVEAPDEAGGLATNPASTDVLASSLRVLVNVTHHNPTACTAVAHHNGLRAVMDCFVSRKGIPAAPPSPCASTSSVFDVQILALTILANCVEINSDARQALASLNVEDESDYSEPHTAHQDKRRAKSSATPACAFLVQFLTRHAATFADALAREIGDTDGELDADDYAKALPAVEETTGMRHAFDGSAAGADAIICADAEMHQREGSFDQGDKEDLILCGYTSLLLGCMMRDQAHASFICSHLPGGSPRFLVRLLNAFVMFQSKSGVLMAEGAAPVIAIIQELQENQGAANVSAAEPAALAADSEAQEGAKGNEAERLVAEMSNTNPMLTHRYGAKRKAGGASTTNKSAGLCRGSSLLSDPVPPATDGPDHLKTQTPISALKESGAPPRSLKKTVTFSPDVVAHEPSTAGSARRQRGNALTSASAEAAPSAAPATAPPSSARSQNAVRSDPTQTDASLRPRSPDANDGGDFNDGDGTPLTTLPKRKYGRKKSATPILAHDDSLVHQPSSETLPVDAASIAAARTTSSAARGAGRKRQLQQSQGPDTRPPTRGRKAVRESEGQNEARTDITATTAKRKGPGATPGLSASSDAQPMHVAVGRSSRNKEANLGQSSRRTAATNSGATGQRAQRSPRSDPESDFSVASGRLVTDDRFSKGTIVEVEKRTGPGINKLGGTARVIAVHATDRGVCTYDVKYITEGGYEKGLDEGLLSMSPASEDAQAETSGATSKIRRKGRSKTDGAIGSTDADKTNARGTVPKEKTASSLKARPYAPECSLGMLAADACVPTDGAPAASSSSRASVRRVKDGRGKAPVRRNGTKTKRKADQQGGRRAAASIPSVTLEAVATSATPIVARKRKKFQLRGSKEK